MRNEHVCFCLEVPAERVASWWNPGGAARIEKFSHANPNVVCLCCVPKIVSSPQMAINHEVPPQREQECRFHLEANNMRASNHHNLANNHNDNSTINKSININTNTNTNNINDKNVRNTISPGRLV